MISPTSTGTTIVDVIPRTHVSPRSSAATPTRSQAATPASRSQRGAENTAESCLSCSVSSWTTEGTSPSACAEPWDTSAAERSSRSTGCRRSFGNFTLWSPTLRCPAPPAVAPDAPDGVGDRRVHLVEDVHRHTVIAQPGAERLHVRAALGARQEDPLGIRERRSPAALAFDHRAPERHQADRAVEDARLVHLAVQVQVLRRELRIVRRVDAAAAARHRDVVLH